MTFREHRVPSGEIVLKLKTKYSDGTTHLLFSGVEFVEKLAALIPPPRIHLTRFFGCLAPHSKIRSQIVPKQEVPPESESTEKMGGTSMENHEEKNQKMRMTWAKLLARVFAIDMTACLNCWGNTQSHLGHHGNVDDKTNPDSLENPLQTPGYRTIQASYADQFSLKRSLPIPHCGDEQSLALTTKFRQNKIRI